MKKYIALLGFAALLTLPLRAWADAAPEPPGCSENMDYSQSPSVPVNPSCGYLVQTTSLEASSYADRFVFLELKSCDNANTYTLEGSVMNTDYERFVSYNYIAIDKNYFQFAGGINGIFNSKNFTPPELDGEGCYPDSPVTMEPKNPTDFAKYSYNFVVSKDDPNLYIDPQNLINNKYSEYSGLNKQDGKFAVTNDLSCTQDNCSENFVYTPQSIDGNYIIVAPTKTELNPPSLTTYKIINNYTAGGYGNFFAASSSTPPSSSPATLTASSPPQQNATLPPNPETQSTTSPVSAPHVSWIHRVWNNIVSFFKSLF